MDKVYCEECEYFSSGYNDCHKDKYEETSKATWHHREYKIIKYKPNNPAILNSKNQCKFFKRKEYHPYTI